MKNMKLIKSVAVLLSLSGVIVALGFGCGVGFTTQGGSTTQLSVSVPGTTVPGNIDGMVFKPGTQTYGTAVHTSLYNSLMSKLNLDPAVAAQVTSISAEFTNQRNAMSETGKSTAINASFVFAATALSAAGCLDRINFERNTPASKLFFNAVDLNAASTTLTDDMLRETIRRLARGLYADNETAAEAAILLTDVKASMADDPANDAVETREAMLYLCTAMASSTMGISQ